MIKTAVVQPGSTPSVVSGRPSDFIKHGEAVCAGEELPDIQVETQQPEKKD